MNSVVFGRNYDKFAFAADIEIGCGVNCRGVSRFVGRHVLAGVVNIVFCAFLRRNRNFVARKNGYGVLFAAVKGYAAKFKLEFVIVAAVYHDCAVEFAAHRTNRVRRKIRKSERLPVRRPAVVRSVKA